MSLAISEGAGSFGRISLVDIDQPVGTHAHPHYHALIKVGGSDSIFEVDGSRYPLTDDFAVVVNSWQPHSYPFRSYGSARILALYIRPSWMENYGRCAKQIGYCNQLSNPSVYVKPQVRNLVRCLSDEIQSSNMDDQRAIEGILKLVELLFTNETAIGSNSRLVEKTVDYRITRSKAILDERVREPINFTELASSVAMSRAHFFYQFRKQCGVTPQKYHAANQMELAYEALSDSRYSVCELSRSLGFSAHAHFSRFFRTNHGVSPIAYRKALWTTKSAPQCC